MPRQFPSRALDKFVLRLPEGMRDSISTSARNNNRTMNAEIISRLEASLEAENKVPDFVPSATLSEVMDIKQTITALSKRIDDLPERLRKLVGSKKRPTR